MKTNIRTDLLAALVACLGFLAFGSAPLSAASDSSNIKSADPSSSAYYQNDKKQVSGTVIDNEGLPVIGAAVIEKGTANGVVTDFDGNYTISVDPDAVLVVSFLGFNDSEVSVSGRTQVDVTLSVDENLLEEVVVTGYTVQRKADLTGSISIVDTDDMTTSFESDPMKALQGKVPGMTVTSTGSPSGTATIRIRGVGSINSSQDPLYIIDGVPTTRSLNSLNTNDIESMQVLKDAASASIYGARAANGVIIITTKKGKQSDRVHVDFNASVTAQFYTSQSLMSLCNTQQYATAMAQAALNDGLDPVAYAQNYGLTLNASDGVGITVWNPATSSYQNYVVNGYYDGYINEKQTMRFSDTDWLDEISRTGIAQQYDLSVSQATEKASTMFSLGYKRNDGIIKYTDFQSISARMNSSYKINKYVTIGENFTLSYSEQCDVAPMENALKMAPTVPVYEEDGETFSGPVGGMSDRQNPLREAYDNRNNDLKYWRLFGNAFVDIHPVKNLTIRSNFGIDYYSSFINSLTYTYSSDIVNNDTASTTLSHDRDMTWTWTNTATYELKINKKHTLNFLLGQEMIKQNEIDFSGYSEGYTLETTDYMWPDAATGVTNVTGSKSSYKLSSFFAKVDYNYDDLILASATVRHDGSSRFGANHRWGTFPAASLGFRISKLIDKPWMDELKLRVSWGQTGNQDIDNNAQFGLYVSDYGSDRVTSTAYDLNLQGSGTFPSGYRATQRANADLKWESATQFDVGVDYRLFDDSLYGSIDGYIKDVKDMLISPAYLGAWGEGGDYWTNGPSMRNWGMEFVLGYRKVFNSGFSFDVSGNLDFYRNWVTYLPESSTGSYAHTSTENLVEARKPYGSSVGYVVEGLFQSQEEVDSYGQTNARVGGLKYKDLDGDGVITEDDQTWIYNPVPDFSYGINISLGYKNFDFSMFWQGVSGQDVYNNQKFQTDFWSLTDAGSNKGSRVVDAWTTDNTSSTIPALTTDNTADEGRASSYYVENGSYLKLRTLQIGYALPSKILENAKISNVRFYLSGQNLLTIKSKSLTCTDPENPDWNYPLATSVTFGVQLSF